MYSSGGMSNYTLNAFTSPSPSFPLHYYQEDPRDLEELGHKLITSDGSAMSPRKKKSGENNRKDRHSKIVTAQGLRDRRVRLSIPVARKFFDLHDTLGFDKASETLDWLLTKSQPAIDDLVKKSKHCYMKSKAVILSNGINNITQDQRVSSISSLLPRVTSRAKARARARERTRQKMSTRHLNLVAHDFRIPANPWNELSYNNKSRAWAPYFNVATDQICKPVPDCVKPTTSSILDRIY